MDTVMRMELGVSNVFFTPVGKKNKSLRIAAGGGGGVAQSVERSTPGEEVPGSIPAVTVRSLLAGSVSV